MGYPILNVDPKKAVAQYIKYKNKKVLFKGRVVEVYHAETSNQVGSYERGIAWNRSEYGILVRSRTKDFATCSADHGVTWHKMYNWEKAKVLRYTRKGRIKLTHTLDKELAFEGIQKINRQWEGDGYRWKP